MTNILVIPDSHSKPGVDNRRYNWLGKFIVDRQPDVIVNIGDWYDMESLSSYDKGKKSFEGRKYKADINAGNEAIRLVEEEIWKLNIKSRAGKRKQYKPRKISLLGNHECVSEDTEILTDKGFILSTKVNQDTYVGSFTREGLITYNKPVAITSRDNTTWIRAIGDFHDELVSDNHRLFIDNSLKQYLEAGKYKQNRFKYSGTLVRAENSTNIDMLRAKLLTWIVMDGCIHVTTPTKMRIQFKLSKLEKIEKLRNILELAEIPYTFKECKKTGLNKLQPYYIRIYGEYAKELISELDGVKRIPANWATVDETTAREIISTILDTDGYRHYNKVAWTSTDKHNVDVIQMMCIHNNIPCAYSKHINSSGFSNAKVQYHVKIADNGLDPKRHITLKYEDTAGKVIAIQTVDGTLITRRNGKVVFTGNCRIERVVNEQRELEDTISYSDFEFEKYGWEVIPYLKPIFVEGVCFAHYFTTGVMGRPVSGETPALKLIRTQFNSCVMGHVHTRDFAERTGADGTRKASLIVGCYLDPEQYESYAGEANKIWWKGLVMLNNVKDGSFDPEFISIETLQEKYA